MPSCPNCQAEVITDAQFCEACGYRLAGGEQGTVEVRNVERPAALPGSLRNEIPFLSGAVRQAKARLESWKEQTERDKREARREEELRQQEEEQAARKGSGKRSVWLMLVGLLVLAAWVWLIIRFPPKANPMLKWQLLQEMRREFGLD